MNILFVDQFGDLGGGQQCLLDLIPAVVERGWRAVAAIPPEGELTQRLVELGVTVEPIAPGHYSYGRKSVADVALFLAAGPPLALRLRSLIRKHAIDLVYVNGPRVLPAAALAARGLPIVFHAHNHLPPGLSRRLVRAALDYCTEVISVSQFTATYLGRGSVRIIPNGAGDLSSGTKRPGPVRVGMIGRIAPEKGQLDFVEAVRLLPRDWEFLVAGTTMLATPSYAGQVRARASGLPVRFVGWQSDLRQLYAQLDLVVVPSAPGEGFGRVIIEAFSAGVPVVAYDSGGIGELIEDGVTGYLVRPQTPEALASAIGAAIASPEQRRSIAHQAQARWESRYTLQHYRDRVTSVIACAANKVRAAATSNTGV